MFILVSFLLQLLFVKMNHNADIFRTCIFSAFLLILNSRFSIVLHSQCNGVYGSVFSDHTTATCFSHFNAFVYISCAAVLLKYVYVGKGLNPFSEDLKR